MSQKTDYDVIIIGAGISGLVCGCYLAKAGLKTLIIEKNSQPGGYCTSFVCKGMIFDSCVHSLGSCRDGGSVNAILKDLDIRKRLNLQRKDPSDVIVFPDGRVSFWHDINRTVKDFEKYFPGQSAGIKSFFRDILNTEGKKILPFRDKTFEYFLNIHFQDPKIKAVLALPVLGNMGLSASRASAFAAIKLYREFMLDGGYYPEGGMQVFSNTIFEKFKELGGEIVFGRKVEEILIEDNVAKGVRTRKKELLLNSKFVVSAADAVQTFLNLCPRGKFDFDFVNKLSSLRPSLSMHILYLGFKKDQIGKDRIGTNEWYLPSYDVETLYTNASERTEANISEYMAHFFSSKHMAIYTNASFNERDYWDKHKKDYSNKLISLAEAAMPWLKDYVVFKSGCTPQTLYKTTLNLKGAAYGWAQMPHQFAVQGLSRVTPIENLFLTGHWTTRAQGIGGVVYLGKDTARMIAKN